MIIVMHCLNKHVPLVVDGSDVRFVLLRKVQKLCVSNWCWGDSTVVKHASDEKQIKASARSAVYFIFHKLVCRFVVDLLYRY